MKAIAINRAHELAPWADVLYGCDARFWQVAADAMGFAGLKLCADPEFCKWHPDFGHVRIRRRWSEIIPEPGEVGDGNNGGFQALNLAVQARANPILLLGFDMNGDRGLHFHGAHPRPLTNPTNPYSFDQWRNGFRNSETALRGRGIRVINCAPASALNSFPKMSVAEALASL